MYIKSLSLCGCDEIINIASMDPINRDPNYENKIAVACVTVWALNRGLTPIISMYRLLETFQSLILIFMFIKLQEVEINVRKNNREI